MGISVSPKPIFSKLTFEKIEIWKPFFSLTCTVILVLSLCAFVPGTFINSAVRFVILALSSLLHISIWPIVVITSGIGFFLAHRCDERCTGYCWRIRSHQDGGYQNRRFKKYRPCGTMGTYIFALAFLFCFISGVHSLLQIVYPSWMWNPFLWGAYQVYLPGDIQQAMKGICHNNREKEGNFPLCLSKSSWITLSSGGISDNNKEDVASVLRGIKYAKNNSGGIIINVMSRDTVNAIKQLRQNVEGLIPFFKKVSVVVFENDSVDNTRDEFKKWASTTDGYEVDLMECEDAPDCKFGESHRYDAVEAKDYFKSSAIGSMAMYRQRIVDYVNTNPKYHDFSHMIVIDLDLGVSISPFGVLHSLGKLPDSAVASSGRQVWPGSLGTQVPPYDFSAFQPQETPQNEILLALHRRFCGLMPVGDRWRNQCDAASPMKLFLVLHLDSSNTEPYQVDSAFNGAVIYPLALIRDSGAKYDSGEDGQRCEHIGFNKSLKKPVFVNPKWNMHVKPNKPGGPEGKRALKNVLRIMSKPQITMVILSVQLFFMIILVYLTMMLVICFVYPLWLKIITGSRFRDVLLPVGDSTKGHLSGKNDLDIFLVLGDTPRKRKNSDNDEEELIRYVSLFA